MRVLPLVLIFTAASGHAAAQHFVCTTIRRGDTAAQLAVRLTNNPANRHEPWFQILDPATSRFVSKAAYDVILPGWRVCVAREAVRSRPMPQNNVAPDRVRLPTTPLFDRLAAMDLTYSWVMAFGVLALLLAVPATKRYVDKRRAMLDSMTRFAAIFVREFERPLPRRHAADRPITARLRCAPCRARLDILLAPNQGHCYPNVSDHKKNLDYDIQRVLRIVPHQPFVRGEPYPRGDWVVIPFQVKAGVPEEGAK